MNSSLDLQATLSAIVQSAESLIPADHVRIVIWNETRRSLIPYTLVGSPGIDRRLEKSPEMLPEDASYTGALLARGEPLLVKDFDQYQQAHPTLPGSGFAFKSYLGMPLLLDEQVLAVLVLASFTKEAFTESDLEALRILSTQAAVALNNAILFRVEQRRVLELDGLVRLSQATGTITDMQELCASLVDSITPLLDVKLVGFLTYDVSRHVLQAQSPFIGIPEHFIDL